MRWIPLVLLLSALSVSGYHRRRARIGSETIDRRREGGPLMAARAFVAIPLLLALILHVVAPGLMAWATWMAPEWVRWAGVAVGVLTLPFVHWVLSSIGRNVSETVLTKLNHELVMTGPYRWIRHPLYTSGVTLLLALGAIEASWLVLLLSAVVLLLIRTVVIPLEERALQERFGDRYFTYASRTGRLLPRLVGPT